MKPTCGMEPPKCQNVQKQIKDEMFIYTFHTYLTFIHLKFRRILNKCDQILVKQIDLIGGSVIN